MATGMTGQERRSHPRIRERVALALAHEQGAVEAETQNLSAAGVYCTVAQFVPPMTKMQVAFELPHGQRTTRIRCTGVVVRVDPILSSADRWRYHLGIFFTDLADRDRSAIAHFVQQQLSQASS